LKGTVTKWLDVRGFGFIKPKKGGKHVFCHSTDVPGVYDLHKGDNVEFDVETSEKGPRATNVKILY
jgi:CspA family cold shock protein